MQRVKIELPQHILFTCTIPVRITDVNYGNHVGNDSILSILHDARMQYLSSLGFTEVNAAGASLIMADAMIEFKNQSFYGDILTAQIYIGEVSRVSFDLFYTLTTIRDNKEILIVKAKTGMVCFDYSKNKVVCVPVLLQEKLTIILN